MCSPQLSSMLVFPFGVCKARYTVLFQIRTFPPEPEDEAHIDPTATYDEVIYPGFQHDITALQITRIQHLIQSAYKCLNTIQQRKIHVWVQTTYKCLMAKVKHTKPTYTRVHALRRGPLASRRRVFTKASRRKIVELHWSPRSLHNVREERRKG